MLGQMILELQPDQVSLSWRHVAISLQIDLLPVGILEHPLNIEHPVPVADGPAADVDVLGVEHDEVGLLGQREDELDHALDPRGVEVGCELNVIPNIFKKGMDMEF